MSVEFIITLKKLLSLTFTNIMKLFFKLLLTSKNAAKFC
jgi:hypothetical protein